MTPNNPNVGQADYKFHCELRFWSTDNQPQEPTPQRRDEVMRNLRTKILALLAETGGQASNIKESLDGSKLTGFSFAYTEGTASGIVIVKLTAPTSPQTRPNGAPIEPPILNLVLKESSTNSKSQ